MRLRPTLFAPSRQLAQVAAGDLGRPSTGETGSDGDYWLADLAGGGPDVNPELSGNQKFHVYDEMSKTDPGVKGLLLLFSLTARSAQHGLDDTATDPVARAVRDFVAWNLGLEGKLGELDLSYGGTVAQGFDALKWGVMLEELVWDDVRTWIDADGDQHLVRPLARLAPRLPGTVQQVERDAKGRILRVTQRIAGTRPIPADKLCYFNPLPEAGRWDGVSVLRPAWGAWRIKKELLISAGIGWDRFAMGLPVVWHPDTPDGSAKAKTIGRSIRSHERAYVAFPTPAGMPRSDSEWGLDILNAAATLADPTPLLRFVSEQIAEAGLQQFTKLGMTGTGSRAVGDVQAEAFYMAVSAFAGELARERSRQVIRRLVQVNFGDRVAELATPTLTVSKIQTRNVETIARALSYLAPAGLTFTDRGAQDDIRELLGFGRLPADLEEHGIPRAQLESILKGLGLDSQTFADIVNALPADLGVARNRAPEGTGLPVAA